MDTIFFIKLRLRQWLTVLLAMCLCQAAEAVVVKSGTGNTTAPVDDPGFANIGTLNGASAIYLGYRWVLTANHVAPSLPGSVNFGGTNYSTENGTWQRLNNNGTPGMSLFADLVLFRLVLDPGLPALPIRASALSLGDDVVMIGNGRDRQAGTTYWNSSWVEVTPPPPPAYTGFKTDATKHVRWGQNDVHQTGLNVNAGNGDTRSFSTTFSESGGFTHEAQGINGDSGGGVFVKNGSVWELAGMMHTISTYSGQPANTAVFGNLTYAADLTFYRTQIVAVVPEPATILLIVSGLAILAYRRPRLR